MRSSVCSSLLQCPLVSGKEWSIRVRSLIQYSQGLLSTKLVLNVHHPQDPKQYLPCSRRSLLTGSLDECQSPEYPWMLQERWVLSSPHCRAFQGSLSQLEHHLNRQLPATKNHLLVGHTLLILPPQLSGGGVTLGFTSYLEMQHPIKLECITFHIDGFDSVF